MNSDVHGNLNSRHVTLRRAFWALMGLAHAPALLGACWSFVLSGFDVERLGGCLGLGLAMVFFALKWRDVSWLRFRADRRSIIAFCMVVGLLHLDVIHPDGNLTMVPESTALVATGWLVGRIAPLRRTLGSLLSRTDSRFQRLTHLVRSADTVWLDAFRPHCWVLLIHLFVPRAPPL